MVFTVVSFNLRHRAGSWFRAWLLLSYCWLATETQAAAAAESGSVSPLRPPQTVAHQILSTESTLGGDTTAALQLLESILQEAVAELSAASGVMQERTRARRFFDGMDRLLVRRGFVYPPTGLVSLLSDALTPRSMTAPELTRAIEKEANWRRKLALSAGSMRRRGGTVHVSDCDTSAVIYLAVAERLGYPCRLVEVPGHNFLRWESGKVRMNFDPNTGRVRSDAFYRSESGLTSDPPDCVPYLKPMNRDGVLGYWQAIVGREHARAGAHAVAKQAFERGIVLAPASLYAAHELGWFLATCPDPRVRDGNRAAEILGRVARCWPDPGFLDSWAVALAEARRFDEAVRIEKQAIAAAQTWRRSRYVLGGWPPFQLMIEGFSQERTYLEIYRIQQRSPKNPNPPAESP